MIHFRTFLVTLEIESEADDVAGTNVILENALNRGLPERVTAKVSKVDTNRIKTPNGGSVILFSERPNF